MEKYPGDSLIHLDAPSWFNPASVSETLRRAVFDFHSGKIHFVSRVKHGPEHGLFAMG
jgi:hypothetical protein